MSEHWRKYTTDLAAAYAQAEPFVQPATPQPSAPVVACKAPTWCGFKEGDRSDPRRARYIDEDSSNYGHRDGAGHFFCSPTCRDAKLPPLAAQPAEAKRSPFLCGRPLGGVICNKEAGHESNHGIVTPWINLKPAEQPKPAAKVESAKCERCPSVGADYWTYDCRALLLCGDCQLEATVWLGAQNGASILRDPAIPERLPRPRLAHVAGMDDDDLIGGDR